MSLADLQKKLEELKAQKAKLQATLNSLNETYMRTGDSSILYQITQISQQIGWIDQQIAQLESQIKALQTTSQPTQPAQPTTTQPTQPTTTTQTTTTAFSVNVKLEKTYASIQDPYPYTQYHPSKAFIVSASVSGSPQGNVKYRLYVNGALRDESAWIPSGPAKFTVGDGALNVGTNTIVVEAEDSGGRKARGSATVTVNQHPGLKPKLVINVPNVSVSWNKTIGRYHLTVAWTAGMHGSGTLFVGYVDGTSYNVSFDRNALAAWQGHGLSVYAIVSDPWVMESSGFYRLETGQMTQTQPWSRTETTQPTQPTQPITTTTTAPTTTTQPTTTAPQPTPTQQLPPEEYYGQTYLPPTVSPAYKLHAVVSPQGYGQMDVYASGVYKGTVTSVYDFVINPDYNRIKVVAKPYAGYRFKMFTVNGSQVTQNPYEFTMKRDMMVQAVFEPAPTQPTQPAPTAPTQPAPSPAPQPTSQPAPAPQPTPTQPQHTQPTDVVGQILNVLRTEVFGVPLWVILLVLVVLLILLR